MKKKVVKKKKKKKNLLIWKCLFLTVIFFTVILFYAGERVEILGTGYRIRAKTNRKRKLIEEKESLTLEAVRLKSPQRLERISKEELGLVYPTDRKSIRRITISRKMTQD